MRVRRLSLARLRDEEQGAVLAMVAISLIVLIGMAVLTFDLGRGVALKRNMVNAADAGALAAARECGLANGEASAMAAADDLVADNNDAATVTGMEINPDPAVCSGAGNPDPDGHNTVTVTVNMPQEYFFAQIFGFDSGTVAATATAEWTMEMSGPAPLKVEAPQGGRMPHRRDRILVLRGIRRCRARSWMAQLPRGLAGRRASPTHRRHARRTGGANDLKDYIGQMGGVTGTGAFNTTLWNVPIWVCAKDGANASAQQAIQDWADAYRERGPQAGRLLPRGGACEARPAPRKAAGPGTGIRMRPTRSSRSRASTSRTCTGVPR